MDKMRDALTELIPMIASLQNVDSIGGGCISEAARVQVLYRDGKSERLFVKSNKASFIDNFRCERDGIELLSFADVLRVPQPIAVGLAKDRSWLVMEWIESKMRSGEFFANFGRSLASLHQQSQGVEIGLDHDNYLGAARQINTPTTSWSEFVAEHRIGFQLRWAVDQGVADETLRRDVDRVIGTMDSILAGRSDSTSLLHGDLWSGNYFCDQTGSPVIVDPAVYRGCREAEFGMLLLFGSCPANFFDSYNDVFPMPAGWQRRTGVYVLYHLLNHLNLFGVGYLAQCRQAAAAVLS